MNSLIFFMIKSTSISAILFAYYWLVLRDKHFHYYNRFYLLFSSILSVLLPFMHFKLFTVESNVASDSINNIELITSYTPVNGNFMNTYLVYIVGLVLLISLFLGILLIFNVVKILRIKSNATVVKMDGVDFINTKLEYAPFAFLNNLFWKEQISLQDALGQKIFKHEITHINQKHTYDVLYSQIVCSILWMNPINWFIQKELKTIHEFIADKEAIGVNNVDGFIELIMQSNYGSHFLNPTNTFFYSSIKRRLFMLKSTNKTKFSYLRRLLLLPITVCLFILMSIGIKNELRAANFPVNVNQVDTLPKNSKAQAISGQRKAVLKTALETKKKDDATLKADLEAQKKDEMELKADLEAQKKEEVVMHADMISNAVELALKSTEIALKEISIMNLDSIVKVDMQTALKELEKSKVANANAKKDFEKAMKEFKVAMQHKEVEKSKSNKQ